MQTDSLRKISFIGLAVICTVTLVGVIKVIYAKSQNLGFSNQVAQPFTITNSSSPNGAATTTEFFGDVVPQVTNAYSLGNSSKQWKSFSVGIVTASSVSTTNLIVSNTATTTNLYVSSSTGIGTTIDANYRLKVSALGTTGIAGYFTNTAGTYVTLADGSAGQYGMKTNSNVSASNYYLGSGGLVSSLAGTMLLGAAQVTVATLTAGAGINVTGGVTTTQSLTVQSLATSTFAGPVSSTRFWVDQGGSAILNGTTTAGPYLFTDDSGAVTAMDMEVTSAAASEQQMSYEFSLDGNPYLQMYSRADAAGGLQTTSTALKFFQNFLPGGHNTLDIGASGTNAVRNIYASGTSYLGGLYADQGSNVGNVVTKFESVLTNATTTPCAFKNNTNSTLVISSLHFWEASSTSQGQVTIQVGTSTDAFTASVSPFVNTAVDRNSSRTAIATTSTLLGGGLIWEKGEWIVCSSATTTHSGEAAILEF